MAIIAYPLNNVDYTAEDAMLQNLPVSSGIYANTNQFSLSLTNGFSFEIGKGLAFMRIDEAKCFTVYSNETTALTLDIADSALSRIDRVVLQWNQAENSVKIAVKKGEYSSTPTPPIRVATVAVYELVLFDILVTAGATKISAGNVTDQRLNESLCGLMANYITKIDLSAIQNQLQEVIEQAEGKISKEVARQLTLAKESGTFDGKTPEKGVDYFTPQDINQIVDEVIARFIDVSEVGA